VAEKPNKQSFLAKKIQTQKSLVDEYKPSTRPGLGDTCRLTILFMLGGQIYDRKSRLGHHRNYICVDPRGLSGHELNIETNHGGEASL
jgi:hypothetical protein